MKWILPIVLFSAGCATVSKQTTAGVPVEVHGHVTRVCAVPQPQSQVQVTLRAAGELEPLETTVTDASGAFVFHTRAPGQSTLGLFVEVKGVRAKAVQGFNANNELVADLTLPCG